MKKYMSLLRIIFPFLLYATSVVSIVAYICTSKPDYALVAILNILVAMDADEQNKFEELKEMLKNHSQAERVYLGRQR